MRRLLPLCLLAVLAFTGCSNLSMVKDASERTKEVIENTTQPKAVAFERLLRWATQTYNSANTVVQRADAESGTIVISALTDVQRAPAVTVTRRYNLTMDVRDNRIRFTYNVGESTEAYGVMRGELNEMMANFDRLRSSALAAVNTTDNF